MNFGRPEADFLGGLGGRAPPGRVKGRGVYKSYNMEQSYNLKIAYVNVKQVEECQIRDKIMNDKMSRDLQLQDERRRKRREDKEQLAQELDNINRL